LSLTGADVSNSRAKPFGMNAPDVELRDLAATTIPLESLHSFDTSDPAILPDSLNDISVVFSQIFGVGVGAEVLIQSHGRE
jgi:hypothetical protein